MNIIRTIFATLNTAVSIYSLLCVARIVITWFPGSAYSAPGRFLSALCDPYLNWFKRFRVFKNGAVDFSPILALGVLSVAASIFGNLAVYGKITLGVIIAMLVSVLWSFFSFILVLLIIVLVIRLIANLLNRDTFSQFWRGMDAFLNPVISRISSLFFRKTPQTYRTELIAALAASAAAYFILRWLTGLLINLLAALPF